MVRFAPAQIPRTFSFRNSRLAEYEKTACPDCEKKEVRIATAEEVKEYWREQEIIRREIKAGLYAAAI